MVVSNSKSEFISTEDGIEVFVEHEDFGPETKTFIYGIANDAWHGDVCVEPDHKDYHKQMNPTLRFWKKHHQPKKPDLHLTKGRLRFVPPETMCLLGPEPQYEIRDDEEQWTHKKLRTHPGCRCVRCTGYGRYGYIGSESHNSDKFWRKITDRIKVEV
jgi:hypothetical protein